MKSFGRRVTETQLIQRARAGDGDAWEALTRKHQEPVFRYAYLLHGDPDEAQDVTQETFVRAFYSLKRFEDGRPLRPWLLRIASRLAHNRHRAANRFLRVIERLGREPQPTADEDLPEGSAEQIRAAVSRLRPAFQEVIYLRYFLALSEDETSAAIGVPAGTVKSRLHRGLHELRKLIAAEYPELVEALPG